MKNRRALHWTAGLAAAGVIALWGAERTSAATITGQNGWSVQSYANVLAGSQGSFGGTGVTDGGAPVGNGVDGHDHTFTQLRDESTQNVYDAYFEYVASQPFKAGTVITWRPNDARVTGNAIVSLGGTVVQDLPDADTTITATPLANPIETDTLRIAYPNGLGTYNASLYASDLTEAQIFPDALTPIAGVAIGGYSPVWWGGTPARMIDGKVMNGWCPSAAADRYVVLDIPGDPTIGAIVLAADLGTDPIDLQFWDGSQYVTFAHVEYEANEIFALRVPAGIQTSQIRFTLGNGPDTQVCYEAMFFEVSTVPEPSVACLLLCGSGVLLRGGRRGGRGARPWERSGKLA
ncbi:MAG: hypothetical protein BWZ02_01848 [Lentisphaerae bacterium ADurb.BinA184]|nr:MAG: hypothetical protein BWZ02_01848 [Lentisphaerae bacterium ADurb.BinA184]